MTRSTPAERNGALILHMMSGAGYTTIAAVFGRPPDTVRYWINPERRESLRGTARAYQAAIPNEVKRAAYREKHKGRPRPRPGRSKEEKETRDKIRRMAKIEARATGVAVETLYERWGVQ